MKHFSNALIFAGAVLLAAFGYHFYSIEKSEKQSLAEAEKHIAAAQQDIHSEKKIQSGRTEKPARSSEMTIESGDNKPFEDNSSTISFHPTPNQAIATLEIPKLNKTLPIIEGTDPASLAKGVGHLEESVYPGDMEQIVLSGHRDTVFRQFGQMELGDHFIVHMPYGSYTYSIQDTEIVPEDDTSVIRDMGEEVLVVTTCYPFSYVGAAPNRFVAYAYPVE